MGKLFGGKEAPRRDQMPKPERGCHDHGPSDNIQPADAYSVEMTLKSLIPVMFGFVSFALQVASGQSSSKG